jgi:hypothetical protein
MIRIVDTRALFADAATLPRFGEGAYCAVCERRSMAANADVVLFTYSLVIVGLVTGVQMLYYGVARRRPMRLGGDPISPERLRPAGLVFTVAGTLAVAVAAVEILSGAAGTDIRGFILATLLIPPVVAWFNAARNRTPH